MIDKKILEEIIYKSPLVLLKLDEETIGLANEYLPYSTGFELECDKKETYDEKVFRAIPNIVWDTYCRQDCNEQRYRIPNGVNGLISLYNICYHLGNNSLMNMGSGIHYHIDCTETTRLALGDALTPEFEKEILEELETWEYGGSYNKKGTMINKTYSGSWIRYNEIGTLEFRIGNMSFDYRDLVKQIIHANDIVRRWKNKIPGYNYKSKYAKVDRERQIAYQKNIGLYTVSYDYKIHKLMDSIKEHEVTLEPTVPATIIKESIKNRVNKLY